jgi:hypothetical protein
MQIYHQSESDAVKMHTKELTVTGTFVTNVWKRLAMRYDIV